MTLIIHNKHISLRRLSLVSSIAITSIIILLTLSLSYFFVNAQRSSSPFTNNPPTEQVTLSTIPPARAFDPANDKNFWKIFVGPTSARSNITQLWPATTSGADDEAESDSTPRLFCFVPPWATTAPSSPAAPTTSSSSSQETVTFDDPLTNFACATETIKYANQGSDGIPFESCGPNSLGVSPGFSTEIQNTIQAVNATLRSGGGCSQWRIAPIVETFLDWNTWSDGAVEDGWSVTVGMRCPGPVNSTSGVAFAAVDDYLDPSSNNALVTETLNQILGDYVANELSSAPAIVDSAPKNLEWPLSGIYRVYYSLYIDSRSRSVLFASTNAVESNSSSSASSFFGGSSTNANDPNVKHVLTVLRFVAPASLFDGNWHLLALVAEKTEGEFSMVRLFVDAETKYSGDDRLNYQRCVKDLSTVISPVAPTPMRTMIRANLTSNESVYSGGAFSAFLGARPPQLYDLQFHKVPLRAVEQAGRAGNFMLSNLDLQGEVALVLGIFCGLVGLGAAFSAIVQVKDEVCGDGGGGDGVETDDFGVATEAGTEGASQLAAGASKKLQKILASSGGTTEKFQMMRRLTSVLAPLLQVFQSIALLFRGFSFPSLFEKPLTYVTFLFSFSFQLPELGIQLPSWTPLALLGGIAFVALVVVLIFGWKDQTTFLETLKRYELFSQANSDYAAQVVLTFCDGNKSNVSSGKNKKKKQHQQQQKRKSSTTPATAPPGGAAPEETTTTITIADAKRDGKSIATNGWYIDEKTLAELLPSVTPVTAARLIKELGSKPRTTVEAVIRRVLLVTRGRSCEPEHAREVANLLLSGTASSGAANSAEGRSFLEKTLADFSSTLEGAAEELLNTTTKSSSNNTSNLTRSLEDFTHCFRKAGLSCTDGEAALVMGELTKLSRTPSKVDNRTLSGKQSSSSSKNNYKMTDQEMLSSPLLKNSGNLPASVTPPLPHQKYETQPVHDLSSRTNLDQDVLEALSAGEDASSGPSRDAPQKRAQYKNFRNRNLTMRVSGPGLKRPTNNEIEKGFDSGKSWRETLKSLNHLATHGTCWKVERIKLDCGDVLFDCGLSMSKDKRSNANSEEADQRDFFIHAKLGSLAMPPSASASVQKFTVKLSWENPLRCPIHDARLMKASDKLYDMLDEDKLPLYHCCVEEQPALKLEKKLGPCRTDQLFICSGDEKCLYSYCHSCLDPSTWQETKIDYYTSLVNIRRNPSQIISLVSFLGLQSVYLPISQNSLMILFCHHSQLCEHPSCYSSITDEFMTALIVAGASVILVTIGLPLYWYLSLTARKKQVYAVFDSPTQWEELLEQDETSLSNLYNKYEQHYITFEPFLMVSRSLLLSAAVAVTEPESLAQMLTVASITVFNTILLGKTAPFIDPYIDVLTKLDLWHSCFLVAFLCFDQASRIFIPGEDVLGIPMIAVTSIFFASYGSVFFKTVIASYLDHRNLEKARELEREEQMWQNDENVKRRLKKLRTVLQKKVDFFGPNHLQPILTLCLMSQSTTDPKERSKFLLNLADRFALHISEEYTRMEQGKKSADSAVLSQFSFRAGSWAGWSRGTGLQSLGEALRHCPDEKKIKSITNSLHKWFQFKGLEKSARSNAFSLLIAMRATIENLDLSNANLTGVYARGGVINKCILNNCNAMSVNFTGSTFSDCQFTGSHLEGAQFGPEFKSQTVSVWSSILAAKSDGTVRPRLSVNFDGSLIAVAGVDCFFSIVQASSGHRLFTSDKFPIAQYISKKSVIRELEKANYRETRLAFSPADATLLVGIKNRIFKYLPNYRTPTQDHAVIKSSERGDDDDVEISLIEFSRSGALFFVTNDECSERVDICSTEHMVVLRYFQSISIQHEWPLVTGYDDFTLVCPGENLSGEGADAGVVVDLVNVGPAAENALSQCRSVGKQNFTASLEKNKDERVIDKFTRLYKFNSSEKFLFVSKDGSTYAQYNDESKKVMVRSFGDKKVDNDDTRCYFKVNNNAEQSKETRQAAKTTQGRRDTENSKNSEVTMTPEQIFKKFKGLPGNGEEGSEEDLRNKQKPNTSQVCSFKVASGIKDPIFLQMPNGTSVLLIAVVTGDNNLGLAQLFSTLSGRKMGQMYFSTKPKGGANKKKFGSIFKPKIHSAELDRTGNFVYVTTTSRMANADGDIDVDCVFVSKLFLSFGLVAERAVVKTVANDVRLMKFLPANKKSATSSEMNLLAVYDDMHVRKLDLKNDIKELSSMTVAVTFDEVAINPVTPNIVALREYSYVYLYDIETGEEIKMGKETSYLPRGDEEGLKSLMKKSERPNNLKTWAKKHPSAAKEKVPATTKPPAKKNSKRKRRGSSSDDSDDDSDDDDSDDDDSDDDLSSTMSSDDDSDDEEELDMECPTAIAFSPCGKFLAVGVVSDNEDIYIWNIEKKSFVQVLSRPSRAVTMDDDTSADDIENIVWLDNGRYILGLESSSTKGNVVIFDVQTGICLMESRVNVTCLTQLTPNLLYGLYSRAKDDARDVHFYSVPDLLTTLRQGSQTDPTLAETRAFSKFSYKINVFQASDYDAASLTAVTANAAGNVIAAASAESFAIIDLQFSPDGRTILSHTYRVVITTKKLTPEFVIGTASPGTNDKNGLALSDDGLKLAVQKDEVMKIWDVSSIPQEYNSTVPIKFSSMKEVRDFEMITPSDDAQQKQLKRIEEVQKQQQQQQRRQANNNNTNGLGLTNIFGTEDGGWIFSRGTIRDKESRELVQSLEPAHLVAQKQQEQQQKQSEADKNNNDSNKEPTKHIKKVRRKKVPASGCWRRLETSASLTRYLNNCIVEDVDEFATDPPADALNHEAIIALSTEHSQKEIDEYNQIMTSKATKANNNRPTTTSSYNKASILDSDSDDDIYDSDDSDDPYSDDSDYDSSDDDSSEEEGSDDDTSSLDSDLKAGIKTRNKNNNNKKKSSSDDDDDDHSDTDSDLAMLAASATKNSKPSPKATATASSPVHVPATKVVSVPAVQQKAEAQPQKKPVVDSDFIDDSDFDDDSEDDDFL